jgi:trigger factor
MERLFVNVTVEDLGPCKKLLRVEIEPEKVEAVFEKIIADFQHEAKFPGFRPGKAPKDMVAKRFDKQIQDEAKQKLLTEAFQQAIKDQNFTVVSQPDVEEIQFGRGQPVQFAATVEIVPKFELPPYKGLPAARQNAAVPPEDVERALHLLAERHTDYQTVARELQNGDVAVINYTGTCDGKPITDTAPTARGLTEKKNFWVNVDATSFIPGFGQQLAGMKAGDKRTVTVDFPPDFAVPQLAGRKGLFAVELIEAKQKATPALDEAFAKAYGAENLEKLREGVRADLQNELNLKLSRSIRGQVVQALLDQVQIPLPESLVEDETRNIVYHIVQENQQRGASKEAIDAQKDQIYAAANATAKQRVKSTLVFQRVAEQEGVRIERLDLVKRVQELALQNKMPADKLYKDLEAAGRLAEIATQILNDKVMDLLVQFARIQDVTLVPGT